MAEIIGSLYGGIDTHKDIHVAVVIDHLGRLDKGLVDPLVGTSRRSYSVVFQSRLIVWLM